MRPLSTRFLLAPLAALICLAPALAQGEGAGFIAEWIAGE